MELFQHPTYIGDGVYASHDGYQIWLTTHEGMRIALEPEVLTQLIAYEQHLRALPVPPTPPEPPEAA